MRQLAALVLAVLCFIRPASAAPITAAAYLVVDQTKGILLQKNPDVQRPIASIAKLFTATSAFARPQNDLIEILEMDVLLSKSKRSKLKAGDVFRRFELIDLALVTSDNTAAIALGRTNLAPPNILDAMLKAPVEADMLSRVVTRSMAATLGKNIFTQDEINILLGDSNKKDYDSGRAVRLAYTKLCQALFPNVRTLLKYLDSAELPADIYNAARSTFLPHTGNISSRIQKAEFVRVRHVPDTVSDFEPEIEKWVLVKWMSAWTWWWPFYMLSLIFGDLFTEVFRAVTNWLVAISSGIVRRAFADVFKL